MITPLSVPIIPYQELLGNYDLHWKRPLKLGIIPYQELLGNYDNGVVTVRPFYIIPYQELLGNYDNCLHQRAGLFYYTIPRAIREL